MPDPSRPKSRADESAAAAPWPSAPHLLEAQRIAGLGSWEFDPRKRTIRCSLEMLRIFGWEDGAPPSMARLTEAVHPDDREEVEHWLQEACRSKSTPCGCRFRILRGYDVLTLLGRAHALVADGGGLKVIGTVQDVSEHMRALRASEENAVLRRGMFESATWGIFQTTIDGRYLAANPALARIYGYDSPREMLLGMTDISGQLYVDPARRDAFVRLMKENGSVMGFESEVRRRDGTHIWISECCREVRRSDGTLLFYEGTVEEITPRKRTEADLVAAKEQAETANRAKTTFLNNMSHELRTPLNAILGFAEIMRDEMFGPLGAPPYAEYANDIHASGRRLLNIINDILDVTRIESHTLALRIEEVAVAEAIDSCVATLTDAAHEQEVAITLVRPAQPLSVNADPTRLRQIVTNLLSNAIKFSGVGKTVTVLHGHDTAGDAFIEVRDQGIGMTAEEVRSALQPFHQIDTSLARRFEGTGLGLTLVNSLVALHGGRLDIESEPGVGTTVRFTLPGARPGEYQAPKSNPIAM